MTDPYVEQFRAMVAFLGGDALASRAANGLLRINVRTPEQLANTPMSDIRDARALGVKCIERITSCMTGSTAVAARAAAALDYGSIARYLAALQRDVVARRSGSTLTPAEQAHVAEELGRLAAWYETEHGDRQKEEGDAQGVPPAADRRAVR